MTPASFLETLLSLSLQVAVVVTVTQCLARCSQAQPHADKLWMSCHVAVIVLVVLGFGMPHLRLLPHSTITERIGLANLQRIESDVGSLVFFVWMSGVTLSLLALVAGAVQTVIVLRNATLVSPDCSGVFDDISHGSSTIRVLSSRRIAGPFCWQIHQPAIVLPEFVLGLPEDELQMIIRHEVNHLRAGHPLHLFLQRIVGAFFWFHPLVWWGAYHATCCREFRCDRESISDDREAIIYLRSLLRIAENGASQPTSLLAGLPFGGNAKLVRQRAMRLATRTWGTPSSGSIGAEIWISRIAVACLFAALLWIPIDASASDRSLWSPWPRWSANALRSLGVSARDYEIDGHRLREHEHRIKM